MRTRILLALLIVLVLSTKCFAQSGVTKTVSGLTPVQTCTPTDLAMIVDVSDTSMAASGTNKKIQIQYLPQGFPAGSISGVTLEHNIYLPGAISGASLNPTIFAAGTISGVSLEHNPFTTGAISGISIASTVFGSEVITGATLSQNSRIYSIPFIFNKQTLGTTPFAGASTFYVNQCESTLRGVDLIISPTAPVGSGVTIQFYKANKNVPVPFATGTSVFVGSGVSVLSTGVSCFWSWTSNTTTFTTGDVILGRINQVGSGSTVEFINATLKLLRN
jgi:hypothetical protein